MAVPDYIYDGWCYELIHRNQGYDDGQEGNRYHICGCCGRACRYQYHELYSNRRQMI